MTSLRTRSSTVMNLSSLRWALVVAGLLLAGGAEAWAQSPVARLVHAEGEVKIYSADRTQPVPASKATTLYVGDEVQTGPDGRAVVIYDTPPVQQVAHGARLEITSSPSGAPPQAVSSASTTLWGSLWRTVTRLAGGGVEVPALPRQGGVRGQEDDRTTAPALLLPEMSPLAERRPTFAWQPSARSDTAVHYEILVVVDPEPGRCWRGGEVLWDTTVQDTIRTYPGDAPALTPGTTYRVEVWASDRGGDYACLEVISEEERSRLRQDRDLLIQNTSTLDADTQNAFWAAVLIERGYYGDALTILTDVLGTRPDHASGQELWTALLRRAAP